MLKKIIYFITFIFLFLVFGFSRSQALEIPEETLEASLLSIPIAQAQGFDMTIAPAKKIFEVNRGEVFEYELIFRNDSDDGDYKITVVDFAYGSDGARQYIMKEDIADLEQSLTSWVNVPGKFIARKGIDNRFPIKVVIPENAKFGDHFGRLVLEKVETDEGKATVAVGGSIASVLMIKVLGGKGIRVGGLVDYSVEIQERARNTANFTVKFNNTGNEFFRILAEIHIFRDQESLEPVKKLARDTIIYPNVMSEMRLPLGDMGDDAGEGEYLSRLIVYEYENGEKLREMARAEAVFQYFVPIGGAAEIHAAAPLIEKEVTVTPPIVDIIKELFWYIMAFLVALIVLVRVLFYHGSSRRGR